MNASHSPQPDDFRQKLLAWYARGHRAMPWREETATAYHIWLAEIMLQQTTVTAVIPYYQRFLQHFPTVHSLAQAPLEDILHLWQGLGYYRRAHLLHTCAKAVVEYYNGVFPPTEDELLSLPGLGPYTAAVVAATAFNQPANVVDGNVERVISRLYRVQQELPAARKTLREYAAVLASPQHPRLYANAIMELGSQVCTPKNPDCLLCPISHHCAAFTYGDPTAYPRKAAKKATPHRDATAWLLTDTSGHIYLQQRPANAGLLAGLWELPHSGWEPNASPQTTPLTFHASFEAGTYTHTFSHFKLTLNLMHAEVPAIPAAHRFSTDALPPLSTLMAKALQTALKHSQQ